MEKHVVLVGAIQIAFGALGLFIAGFVFVVVVGSGLISGDEEAMAVTAIVGPAVAGFLILVSVPGIIGGIGLLKRRRWARIVVLVISVLDIMNVPFGTIMGIYSIWVLMQSETEKLFAAGPK